MDLLSFVVTLLENRVRVISQYFSMIVCFCFLISVSVSIPDDPSHIDLAWHGCVTYKLAGTLVIRCARIIPALHALIPSVQ